MSNVETTDDVVWRSPPERTRRADAFVDKLRERPGEWAVYRDGVSQSNAHSNASILRKEYPDCEWRGAPSSSDDPEHYAIYGRFIGGE